LETVLNFLLISGIVINTIIIWLLTKTNKSALPQKILIALFIGIIFLLVHFYSILNKIKFLYILTFNIQDVITLLVGPLLYIYVKSLFFEDKELIKKNRIHFILPIIYLVFYSIPILVFSFFKIKLIPFVEKLININDFIFVIEDFYLLAYLILTLILLNKYNKAAKSIYSNLKDKELRWVKYMLFGTILVSIIDIFTYIYDFFYVNSEIDSAFITVIFVVILLYFLGYYGIKQSAILVPEFLLNPVKNSKSSGSLINMEATKVNHFVSKINEVLIKDKLFLDEDLTLHKLAIAISLSDKKLSAIINQEMDTSFYDLINSYRIAEFKRRIISKKYNNLTLLGIAYDCGFKSKSTFNRLFKLKNGISPSEFKKINS